MRNHFSYNYNFINDFMRYNFSDAWTRTTENSINPLTI